MGELCIAVRVCPAGLRRYLNNLTRQQVSGQVAELKQQPQQESNAPLNSPSTDTGAGNTLHTSGVSHALPTTPPSPCVYINSMLLSTRKEPELLADVQNFTL